MRGGASEAEAREFGHDLLRLWQDSRNTETRKDILTAAGEVWVYNLHIGRYDRSQRQLTFEIGFFAVDYRKGSVCHDAPVHKRLKTLNLYGVGMVRHTLLHCCRSRPVCGGDPVALYAYELTIITPNSENLVIQGADFRSTN